MLLHIYLSISAFCLIGIHRNPSVDCCKYTKTLVHQHFYQKLKVVNINSCKNERYNNFTVKLYDVFDLFIYKKEFDERKYI